MRHWIKTHPAQAGVTLTGIVGVAVVVLVWFQPQGLLFDQRVDEDLPPGITGPAQSAGTSTVPATGPTTGATTVATTAPEAAAATPEQTTSVATTTSIAPPEPVVLSDSRLVDVGRAGTGRVLIVELADGGRIVRLEDLDVVNGPDLVVILSPSPLVDDRELYDDGEFVSLGELKGNQGNQNYDIPPDVNLEEFGTVAIWCRRFNYTFNAAAIELVST